MIEFPNQKTKEIPNATKFFFSMLQLDFAIKFNKYPAPKVAPNMIGVDEEIVVDSAKEDKFNNE